MIDEERLLPRLNKSKRKELFAFLKEHDREDSRIIHAGELPKHNRADGGMIVLIMAGQNIHTEHYKDFWVLIDTLDSDGQETFQKIYKRQSVILELLGAGGTRYNPVTHYVLAREAEGRGRPRRELTQQEKASIDEMRQNGAGLNRIAKELHIGARRVKAYLLSKGGDADERMGQTEE